MRSLFKDVRYEKFSSHVTECDMMPDQKRTEWFQLAHTSHTKKASKRRKKDELESTENASVQASSSNPASGSVVTLSPSLRQ
jgi:hypothetical protein